jgi:hypothetical protein
MKLPTSYSLSCYTEALVPQYTQGPWPCIGIRNAVERFADDRQTPEFSKMCNMSGYGYVSYRISTSVDIPKASDMCPTALSGHMHTDMDFRSAPEQTDKENLE